MKNLEEIFSGKFRDSSLIYLTINDKDELRKQLTDVFFDVWYFYYYYDFSIVNLDQNYLENKLNSRIKSLLINYSERTDDFNNILSFIICIVNKIKDADEFFYIKDIYCDNNNVNLLTTAESYKLKKLSRSDYFKPLLKALDLTYLENDNHMIFDTNYFLTQDLLTMIDQRAVLRMQSIFLS